MKRQHLILRIVFLLFFIDCNSLIVGAALEENLMKATEEGVMQVGEHTAAQGGSLITKNIAQGAEDVTVNLNKNVVDLMGDTHVGGTSIFDETPVTSLKSVNVPKIKTPAIEGVSTGVQDGVKSLARTPVSLEEDVLGDVIKTPGGSVHPLPVEEEVLSDVAKGEEVAAEKVVTGTPKTFEPMEMGAEEVGVTTITKISEDEAKVVAESSIATEEEVAQKSYTQMAKDAAISGIKGVGEISAKIGETLALAVLFMIPSIFQSAFIAQEQLNALLTTIAAPIEFGNVVLQIPDSAINMNAPAQSNFIYYGIPVDKAGATLSAGAASMYPGVHGPSRTNKVSAGIHNSLAKILTLGAGKTTPPPARYNLDATALASLPIFVAYSDKSWGTWGSAAITDPIFEQMLVNLNTGYVFFADGLSENTPAATLVGTGANQSVQSFLATKLGQLSSVGAMHSYTEYADTFSSSKSNSLSSPISNQFNCACLTKNKGVLSDDALKACKIANTSTCLLVSALEDLSAGLIINADGKELTKDQDLAKEIEKGALGQVIPIQGLGDKFEDYLSFFPGSAQDSIANSGILTVSLGYGSESAGGQESLSGSADIKVKGADVDNYAAKGIYVYQCKNTEFAKILKSQAGGSATTAFNDHINDFIVFLDKELNQLPLMIPAQDPTNYNFPTMILNPEIMYVSTIIGNSDSQGGFTLLPQLNIQSPQSLVTQGLPATFPPLFGLTAQNGSLIVNYNQTLNNKIGPMAQSLESHDDLGQQYQDIKAAMLRLLYQGPFGKYNLEPIDKDMQPVIGGVNLVIYTGYNAYPVAHDEKSTNCTDVLIPISSQGKTVVLPSNNVASYYGMVSDLTYTVTADGSMIVENSGFDNSPFSQKVDASSKNIIWTINPDTKDQYYWVTQLTNMGKSADPNFELPQSLIDFVQARRADWINWIDKTSASSLSNQEFAGIAWAGTKNILTIVGQQVLVNGLYLYMCNPNPSKLSKDYFVLTNSSAPLASDRTLGTIKASAASDKTYMFSIVSGLLYDSSGVQVKNTQGIGYQVDAKDIIQSMYGRNSKGFSDDFKSKINIAYGQYQASEDMLIYPFNFYNLKLGMYQGDIDRSCYIYFDASGAGTSTNFEPKDYFVTVDLDVNPAVWAHQLSSSTKYVMSLVTGQVYNQTGPKYTLSSDKVLSAIASLSPTWRSGLKDKVMAARTKYTAQQKSDEEATKKMDQEEEVSSIGSLSWKSSDVLAMIQALKSQQYLPAPYMMLKQDPISKQYVQVSPASTNGTDFLYTFFDVPNTYKDTKGNPVRVATMYDSKGQAIISFGDLQLESSLIQNGILIDESGQQTLGVPSLQPIMLLDKEDYDLQPGATGKSMICSNHEHFPSSGIKSPISYQGRKFYFYYNTIMKNYYVMEVYGSDIRYVSMAGGNIYNLDGSFRAIANPVAIKMDKDVADESDMLLPYLNNDSYTQCFMKNHANKGLYSDFINIEKSFKNNMKLGSALAALNLVVAALDPYNQVNIVQMPRPEKIPPMPNIHVATQYNVYWDENNPTVYKVDSNYAAQNLVLLPLNMNDRSMLKSMPSSAFKNARLIVKQGVMTHLLFNNNLYKVSKTNGSVHIMQQVDNPAAPTITISLKKDEKTGVHYNEIVAGINTYNYQIAFDVLSEEQLNSYRHNAWKAETVVDVTGNIVLVQFLPQSNSGQVELASVTDNQVKIQNLSNNTSQGPHITRVKKNIMHDKYIAQIFKSGGTNDQGPFYSYFNQDGYVDLETGVLFDKQGVPVGSTLHVNDLVALLNTLGVSIVRDKNHRATLVSRLRKKKRGKTQAIRASGSSRTIKTNASMLSTGKAKALDFKAHLNKAQKGKIMILKSHVTQEQTDKIAKFKGKFGQMSNKEKQGAAKSKMSQMTGAQKSKIKNIMNTSSDEKQSAIRSRLNQSQSDKAATKKSNLTQDQTDKIANIKSQFGSALAEKMTNFNVQ